MSVKCFAQLSETEQKHFSELEDSLRKIQFRTFYSKIYANKIEANKQFIALWNEILKDEKSIQYPFDSIKKIMKFHCFFRPTKNLELLRGIFCEMMKPTCILVLYRLIIQKQ